MKINEKIIFKMLYTMAPFYQREEKYLQFRFVLRKKRIPEDEIEVFFFQLSSLFVHLVEANTLTCSIFDLCPIPYSPQLIVSLEMQIGEDIIQYNYDESNQIISFSYQGKTYYYEKDILGNINGIVNEEGKTIVRYQYDGYGNH